eukprot:3077929-Lingulodinium_polyedra.AAC.1
MKDCVSAWCSPAIQARCVLGHLENCLNHPLDGRHDCLGRHHAAELWGALGMPETRTSVLADVRTG